MAVFFVCCGVELATAQCSFTLLTIGRGVPETTAGLYVGAYWGSLMAGRVAFGLIADRIGLHAALTLCMAGAVLGAALLWLASVQGLWLLALIVIGGALAPVFATRVSLTPARVGAAHGDAAIGFELAAAGLGGAVQTAVVGVLAGSAGLEVIGACVFALAVLLLTLHEGLARTAGENADASPAPARRPHHARFRSRFSFCIFRVIICRLSGLR